MSNTRHAFHNPTWADIMQQMTSSAQADMLYEQDPSCISQPHLGGHHAANDDRVCQCLVYGGVLRTGADLGSINRKNGVRMQVWGGFLD